MAYQIIQDNVWATLRYEPNDRYIYHTFHQPIGGEPFRKMLNSGLDTLKKHKLTKWLSDDRNNDQLGHKDIEFSIADWGPRAAKAGWKHWALVVPESMPGRASMRDIVSTYYELGVQVVIFTNLEEARVWLVNV